jgi:hypothetical protein
MKQNLLRFIAFVFVLFIGTSLRAEDGKATLIRTTTSGTQQYKSKSIATFLNPATGELNLYFKWDTFKSGQVVADKDLQTLTTNAGYQVMDLKGRLSTNLEGIRNNTTVTSKLTAVATYVGLKRLIEVPVTVTRKGNNYVYSLATDLDFSANKGLSESLAQQNTVQPFKITFNGSCTKN